MRPRRAAAATALVIALSALPGCGTGAGPGTGAGTGVRVLAKADGWRPGLLEAPDGDWYVLVEIAFDEETAARAWRENRPADEVPRSGSPIHPGIYGEPTDIDFTTEVLVVFSSGQSGTCPGWLAGIDVDGSGAVQVTTGTFAASRGCTDDYRPYRMVLAVGRDLVPAEHDLPTDDVLVDGRVLDAGSLVRQYPSGDGKRPAQ
ncbi:MAG: hypothetical protein FWJ93_07400 [Micromonosporaceae bacterium]